MAGKIPEKAEAAIIGRSLAGCLIVGQLTKLGIGDVVLLEWKQLVDGATRHAAGLARWLAPRLYHFGQLWAPHRHLSGPRILRERDRHRCSLPTSIRR